MGNDKMQATKKAAPTATKSYDPRKVGNFFGDVKAELRRITWTSKEELQVYTKIVVGATFALGLGITRNNMSNWYVVQVLSTHENKVKKAIVEQLDLKGMADYIEEVLVPVENVSEVKKGEQKIVEKKLWPGYLLVRMNLNDDSWSYIKNMQGVIDFLGGDKPTPLSEEEVDEILKDIEEKKSTVVQKHQFEVGVNVKIIEGVFVNFIGTITDVQHDKGKLSVRVSIFGRETQVDDLEFTQIEEISEDSEQS